MEHSALLGSIWTGSLGLATLLCSRVRCLYKRDPETGDCRPTCGCTEKSIMGGDDVELHEVVIGDTHGVLLLPHNNK